MFIKLYCQSNIHKISKIPDSFSEFKEKLAAIFATEITEKGYTISYQDEEGDKITLSSEEDYQTMVQTDLVNSSNQTLKVFVTIPSNNVPDVDSQAQDCLNLDRRSRDNEVSHTTERISSHSPVEQTLTNKKPLKSILKKKTTEQNVPVAKKDFYQAKVINDCKSLIGDRFEICKNSLITITRFLQAKGQVEAEYNGALGVFNLKDIEIQTKNCSIQVEKPLESFESDFSYRRVQIGF